MKINVSYDHAYAFFPFSFSADLLPGLSGAWNEMGCKHMSEDFK